MARARAALLGYKSWQKFTPLIEKAKAACAGVGEAVEDHFIPVWCKMVPIGSGAEVKQDDFELTRFACHLIAQNGDPQKSEIAAAQTYFAIQTRRQELADLAEAEPLPPTEDERRVLARDELKAHNRALAGAAKSVGVKTPIEYAVFQNHGYKGLYWA